MDKIFKFIVKKQFIAFLVAGFIALSMPLPVITQSPRAQGVLTSVTCTAGGCVSLGVGGLGSVSIQISGTWAGAVVFEGSVDGQTFVALKIAPIDDPATAVTTATANGLWSGGAGGLSIVRVRMTTFTSGRANVSIQGAEPLFKVARVSTPPSGRPEFTISPPKTHPPGGPPPFVSPPGLSGSFSPWAELMASAPTDIAASGIIFSPAVGATWFTIQIGVGAPGSETMVAWNSARFYDSAYRLELPLPAPVVIPAGSRVSARMAMESTSTTPWGIALSYYSLPIVGSVTTTTAPMNGQGDTGQPGVFVNFPGTAWASSPWGVLAASTATPMTIHSLWFYQAQCVNQQFEIDLGVGAPGLETVIHTAKSFMFDNGGSICAGSAGKRHIPIWPMIQVPAGARLVQRARIASTSTMGFGVFVNAYLSTTGFDAIKTALPQKWVPSNANGAGVTSGAANAAGAWVQFIASTATPIAITQIMAVCGGGSVRHAFEIGIGAPGSEVVVGRHITASGNACILGDNNLVFKDAVNIAAGQRVSVRATANDPGQGYGIALGYIENPDFSQRTNLVQNAYPGLTTTTAITPSTTPWANTPWFQLTASTANDILANAFAFGTLNFCPRDYELDLGGGAPGSEVVLGTVRGAQACNAPSAGRLDFSRPVAVPKLTRLTVRLRSAGTSNAPDTTVALEYLDNFIPSLAPAPLPALFQRPRDLR